MHDYIYFGYIKDKREKYVPTYSLCNSAQHCEFHVQESEALKQLKVTWDLMSPLYPPLYVYIYTRLTLEKAQIHIPPSLLHKTLLT